MELRRRVRDLLVAASITLVAALAAMIGLVCVADFQSKKRVAFHAADVARNQIISDQHRNSMLILGSLRDLHDITTVVTAANGTLKYSTDPPSVSSGGRPVIRMYVSYPVYFDEAKTLLAAHIRFGINVASQLPLAVGLWMAIVILAVPGLRLLLKKTRLAYLREVETRRLVAVAQTTQMLAHDVRKPFSTLLVGINMILRLESDPPRAFDMVRKTEAHVKKALRQVNDFIGDIMEAGAKPQLALVDVQPAELVDAAVDHVFEYRPMPNLRLERHVASSKAVAVDKTKMLRAISNVLDNARHATGPSGKIWIQVSDRVIEQRDYVEFLVGNSGSFIPPEAMDRLFEPFYTSGKVDGTGLGLAIVQKVVAAHDGLISCRSSKEVGTEFVIQLPATASHRH